MLRSGMLGDVSRRAFGPASPDLGKLFAERNLLNLSRQKIAKISRRHDRIRCFALECLGTSRGEHSDRQAQIWASYSLNETSSTYLVKRSPKYLGGMIALDTSLWNAWGRLAESIRTGKPRSGQVIR